MSTQELTKIVGGLVTKIESLTTEMKRGFNRMEERVEQGFAKADVRMDQIDSRIDEFAGMVANEFRRVDKRFDAVDERFDAVDERFEGVEGRLGGVESGLRTLGHKVDAMRYSCAC